MGERHQLFVIARVGKYYRCLAVVHHQWLQGDDVLATCLRLIRIFNDPSNQPALAQEIKLADSFFTGPPGSEKLEYQEDDDSVHFPFIMTCLLVGTSYDPETGWVHSALIEPYNMGFDDGDNNTGITVLDITRPGDTRYCFVGLYLSDINEALSAKDYVDTCEFTPNPELLHRFDTLEVNTTEVLSQTWPYGDWSTTSKDESLSTEQDLQSATEFASTDIPSSLDLGLYARAFSTEELSPIGATQETGTHPIVQLLFTRQFGPSVDPSVRKELGFSCCLYLQDMHTSPVRFANALLQLIGACSASDWCMRPGSIASHVVYILSTSSSTLGSPDLAEIGPLPAEMYKIAREHHHNLSSRGRYCLMRDLMPNTWTVLVRVDADDFGMRMDATVKIRYAFARARKQIAAKCDDEENPPVIASSDVDIMEMVDFLKENGIPDGACHLEPALQRLEERIADAELRDPARDGTGPGFALSFMGTDEACLLLGQHIADNTRAINNPPPLPPWARKS